MSGVEENWGALTARLAPHVSPEWSRHATEHGGQGWTHVEWFLVEEQFGRSTNAISWHVPTGYNVLAHGSPEQIDRYLRPGLRGETHDAYAVTEQRAVPGSNATATVTATGYGNPITNTPDDRPANALDGDPQTAWRVGAISDVANEKLFLDLDRPVTTDHLNLLQPINLVRNRWVSRVRLHFDDDLGPVELDLGL